MLLAFAYPYIYMAEAGFINIHPTLPAATRSSHALLCILFHYLGGSSLCPSVFPHYTMMMREEVANLRITGDVKWVEGLLFAFTLLPLTFSSYLQFLFLLCCPLFFSLLLFFRCVFFIPSCAKLKEEDLK
jgi:hypothetical protein